jgi:hypothetical protein
VFFFFKDTTGIKGTRCASGVFEVEFQNSTSPWLETWKSLIDGVESVFVGMLITRVRIFDAGARLLE